MIAILVALLATQQEHQRDLDIARPEILTREALAPAEEGARLDSERTRSVVV